MYAVSNDYIDKISVSPKAITRRIRGTVDNVPFTENDIVKGTFTYSDKCVNSADINLGGVFVGSFGCTFTPSFAANISRGTWHGRTISFSVDLLIDVDADTGVETWESVPNKSYIIDDATHSRTGVAVKAYDVMTKFDKATNIDTTSGSLFDIASLACEICGVPMALTSGEFALLPNGSETMFTLYPQNDIETWRDMISWIAVTVCGYATITRDNKLIFRTWHNTPDISMDINDRQTGGSWSDFTTYYTGVSIVDIEKEMTRYYSVEPDTGLTMNLGSNPFIQYGVDEVRSRQCVAILNALQEFVYVPFNSSGLLDPCFDLGDVIEYTDGLAGNASVCCVHKIEFKYDGGVKLTGFGKNPALFGARGKTDKNIAGLLSRTSENEVVTHTFMNSTELEITDTETDILNIRFATVSPRTVKLLHDINMYLMLDSGEYDAEVTAYMYLNDELITVMPKTSWDNEGFHVFPFMYFIDDLVGGQQYTWRVALKCERGTIYIDKQGIRALLEAQGLVATDEWNGYIDVSDEFSFTYGSTGYAYDYSDVVSIGDIPHETWSPIELSDSYSFTYGSTGYTFDYTDSVSISMSYMFNPWGTDMGDSMVTDEGDSIYFRG